MDFNGKTKYYITYSGNEESFYLFLFKITLVLTKEHNSYIMPLVAF